MRRIRSGLRIMAIVVVATVTGVGHSVDSSGVAAAQVPQISAVQKIWSQPTHQSFFTDLIRFRGTWICCFREAATHGSVDGYIQLIRSSDGQRWVAASRIDCPPPNQDLRDPKLSITPDGRLMLTATAYQPQRQCRSYVWFSDDAQHWDTPTQIGPAGEWLWRTVWHDAAYNFGRSEKVRGYLQLYRSEDGKHFRPHGARQFDDVYVNETAPVFLNDGTCVTLLRRDSGSDTALIGVAQPPYKEWSWKDLGVRIGGPEMIQLPAGRLVAAVRLYDGSERTSLCWIDVQAGTLEEFLTLPSGGDTSYAGMVWHQGQLWISYYSSHEQKSSIYLAQVTIPLAAGAPESSDPIDVGVTRQLFIDDHVVESMDGVFRVLNRPQKYAHNPVLELKPAQQVGGQQLIVAQGSVIYDAEEKLFKMWYEGATYHWRNNVVCYAYSKDGVSWTLPNLGLVEYQGSKKNNVVLHTGAGEMAPGAFKDMHEQDPLRRYKMLYFSRGNSSPVGVGFSPDGIHWKTTTKGKLIPIGDSLHPVLWDPRLGKYVAHSRHNHITPEGFEQRQVLQSESEDFLNWTRYGVIMKPDEQDPPGHRQFYDMSWMNYEGVYVGFMSVYHLTPSEQFKTPQTAWEDRVDVQLTFSRDNRHWTHAGNRQTFIPNSKRPGDYDYGIIYTMHRPMVVGDEIWIYYVGYSGLHWATRRNEFQGGVVCLAKLRLDGFVSVDTGARGTLTTRPLVMSGDRLVVNADARFGALRVELLDRAGNPIPGFSRTDALPITSDAVRHTVRWQRGTDVTQLRGQPISIRFHQDRCKLFAFQFRAN